MGPYGGKTNCVYSLTSDNALPEDNGMWRCEVINSHGIASATCTVRVVDTSSPPETDLTDDEKLPKFVETLQNLVAKEDTDLELTCKTNPDQELIVKWYKNNIPIQGTTPGMERYYTSEEEGVQKLEIRRSRPRDTGVYKCKIANRIGWVSCDAKLVFRDTSGAIELARFSRENEYSLVDTIRGRKANDYINQRNEADILLSSICDTNTIQKFLLKWKRDNADSLGFPIHLKSKCSVEGCSTILSCFITGKPPFDIRWYKNNNEIYDGFKYYLKNLQGVLSLTIPNTEVDDTGNYMCIVKNGQGKIYSSCYLQVEPTIEMKNEVPMKPMFVKPLKRTTVNGGELINLRVSVKGYPPPGFKWFKDGMEVHDSDRITTEVSMNGVSQLSISNATVRDIGLYSCEAHNMAGRAQTMVRVSVRDKLEEEMWRAKGLEGATIETQGKHITNGEIEQDIVTILHEPKTERKFFDLEPEFKMPLPKALTIQSKQRFLMEIRCCGRPKPFVRWFKDGMELFDELKYNFLSAGDWYGLEIACTQPRDAGRYTVKIQSEVGYTESSCDVEMALPVCKMLEFQLNLETADEISTSVPNLAANRSDLASETFTIAQIEPSFTLCNTEADWTTHIDKEVEVLDADEAPSFPHALPEKICPHENDENIQIECQVRGEPIPKIVWLKNGADLEQGPNIEHTMDPKTRIASLTIKKATLMDSGQYSCVAYGDLGGHATTTADIQILRSKKADQTTDVEEAIDMADDASGSGVKKSLPEFKVQLEDKEATPGAEIRLECKAEGFPAPKVKWYKNDTPITPTIGKYTITSSVEGFHSLIIAEMRVSDGDCYKCEAVNELGATASTAHIIVQEQCEVGENVGDAPSFETSLHNLTVNVGQTAEFVCTAKGKPTPVLSWQKDGVNITTNDVMNIVNEDGVSTLTIEKAKIEDAGLYICTAENVHGKVDACASIKVTDPTSSIDTNQEDVTDGVTAETSIPESTNVCSEETKELKSDAVNERDTSVELQNTEVVSSLQLQQATLIETEELEELSLPETSSVSSSTDYKKRPRFVLPPFSNWTTTDRPLKLEVVVTYSPDMKVNWYHNDQLVSLTEGRYKLTTQMMDT